MDKNMKNLVQWIGALMIGAVLLFMGMSRLEQAKSLEKKMVTVDATVVSFGHNTSVTKAQEYTVKMSYTYNGQKYVGTMNTGFHYNEGDKEKIWILPDSPSVCMTVGSASPICYVMIVLGGLIVLTILPNAIREIKVIVKAS